MTQEIGREELLSGLTLLGQNVRHPVRQLDRCGSRPVNASGGSTTWSSTEMMRSRSDSSCLMMSQMRQRSFTWWCSRHEFSSSATVRGVTVVAMICECGWGSVAPAAVP